MKFDAGFFELASPARTALQKTDQTLSAKRKSDAHALRKSILNKRVSMSCGASPWAIINVNNSIRRSISRENTPIPLPDFEFDGGSRHRLLVVAQLPVWPLYSAVARYQH